MFLRRFDANGRRRGPDIPVSSNTVMDLQRCGDGFAFAAADPAFGLASAGRLGRRRFRVRAPPTCATSSATALRDFRRRRDGALWFGLWRSESRSLFDLARGLARRLARRGRRPRARALIDGLPVTDWQDNYAPKFKGVEIGLENYERSRSLAVRPDRSGFALGTEWYVRASTPRASRRWQQPGPGVAWGVDFSADGQILVVAYGDGTIRWLRGSDGAELLALFVDVPTRNGSPGRRPAITWPRRAARI